MDIQLQLLHCLGEFEAAVVAARDGRATDFQALFRRLDDLTRQLPSDADPQLRHFLEQKSYQKARAWLASRRPA